MKKTDWFGVVRRYLDGVVCERAYSMRGNGEFRYELLDILLSTSLYPWELLRRTVPFSGIVESTDKISYFDTGRFIISYVEISGKLYSCLIDDVVEVGDYVKRTITGKIFLVTDNGERPLRKGCRTIA